LPGLAKGPLRVDGPPRQAESGPKSSGGQPLRVLEAVTRGLIVDVGALPLGLDVIRIEPLTEGGLRAESERVRIVGIALKPVVGLVELRVEGIQAQLEGVVDAELEHAHDTGAPVEADLVVQNQPEDPIRGARPWI